MFTTEELMAFINNWCPEGFDDEPLMNRMMRALMAANSAVISYEDHVEGKQVIRPISSHPKAWRG